MNQLFAATTTILTWASLFLLCVLALYIIVRLVSFAMYKSRAQAYNNQQKEGGSKNGKQLGR